MNIFLVNGAAGSGKTSFEQYVREYYAPTIIMSTVDFVKEIATQCGWTGTKSLKDRKFLSDIKQALIEWDDIPFKKIKQRLDVIEHFEQSEFHQNFIVFIDCREPVELDKFKQQFNAKTILITQEEAERRLVSNTSDQNVLMYNYDIIIDNNENLDCLRMSAIDFVKKIKEES